VPAVVIVAGYPDAGFEKMLGCKFKDMGSSTSWGRLIAASGMAAITYTNREPEADLHAVLAHVRSHSEELGIDASRMGVWASSGNVPLALSLLMMGLEHVKCAALCYGMTLDLDGSRWVADAAKQFGFANPCAGKSVDDLPRDVPLFLARAGKDAIPHLNDAMDRFVAHALARNLAVTLVNHPEAPHAFDLVDDSEMTREIVRRILGFLRFALLSCDF
jgi:acetyl esterase/lipase